MKKSALKIGQIVTYVHRTKRVKVKAVVSGLKHEAANKVRVIDLAADWAPTTEDIAEWVASDALPAGSFVFVPGTPIELKTIVE